MDLRIKAIVAANAIMAIVNIPFFCQWAREGLAVAFCTHGNWLASIVWALIASASLNELRIIAAAARIRRRGPRFFLVEKEEKEENAAPEAPHQADLRLC